MFNGVAVVAIGRNEGERLRLCLDSVAGKVEHVVYVDSGSTDGSVEMARSKGADVVELDMRRPFTAARARNAGFRRVLELMPQARWVQFVDGDCEMVEGWLMKGDTFLSSNPMVAAVNGRRSERYPERSIYNQLCDLEWNAAPGPVKYFGGDVLIRAAAFQQVQGFRPDVIAGEEPELCVRLRNMGWSMFALDAPMTVHDASILHFHQWWKRNVRTGFGYAQGAGIHGSGIERHMVKEMRSIIIWGITIPFIIILLAASIDVRALYLLLIYPLQMLRVAAMSTGKLSIRLLRGVFIVIGKFAETQGAVKYIISHLRGSEAQIIEYKKN